MTGCKPKSCMREFWNFVNPDFFVYPKKLRGAEEENPLSFVFMKSAFFKCS